jgi:nitrous oxidase accessory protein NosD
VKVVPYYDCHPVGEHIHFLYNEAEGSGYGLNYMGYSGDIIGNNFHDLGLYGIRIDLYGSVTEYQDEVIVQDNIITNTTAYGIWLGGSGRVAVNIQLLDNTITGCPSVGILCSDTYDSIINSNSIVGSSIGIRLQTTTQNIQGSGNDCTVLDEGINNNVS